MSVILQFFGKVLFMCGLFIFYSYFGNNIISSTSAYIAKFIDVWHDLLCHFNVDSSKRLRTMSLIPNLTSTDFSKCACCVEAKFTKKPSKLVKFRNTSLLELIHTDLADFKSTSSSGGKNYFITFIDDCSRYTRVYLLRTKDETEHMFIK